MTQPDPSTLNHDQRTGATTTTIVSSAAALFTHYLRGLRWLRCDPAIAHGACVHGVSLVEHPATAILSITLEEVSYKERLLLPSRNRPRRGARGSAPGLALP